LLFCLGHGFDLDPVDDISCSSDGGGVGKDAILVLLGGCTATDGSFAVQRGNFDISPLVGEAFVGAE